MTFVAPRLRGREKRLLTMRAQSTQRKENFINYLCESVVHLSLLFVLPFPFDLLRLEFLAISVKKTQAAKFVRLAIQNFEAHPYFT